jgi:hypothetical protein
VVNPHLANTSEIWGTHAPLRIKILKRATVFFDRAKRSRVRLVLNSLRRRLGVEDFPRQSLPSNTPANFAGFAEATSLIY